MRIRTYVHGDIETQRYRDTERQRDRETERQRQTETDRDRQRQTATVLRALKCFELGFVKLPPGKKCNTRKTTVNKETAEQTRPIK